jgi:hypothetical protein
MIGHDDVVRAVEFAIPVVGGDHLVGAVGGLAHHAARRMLTPHQATLAVDGHAVALVGGLPDDAHTVLRMPAPTRVLDDVAEVQRAVGHPDRTFCETEAGRDPLDWLIAREQRIERRRIGTS